MLFGKIKKNSMLPKHPIFLLAFVSPKASKCILAGLLTRLLFLSLPIYLTDSGVF
jgi:hypothetical protein